MLIIHRKSIMLMHRPQTPQLGFGSITFTPSPPRPFQNPGLTAPIKSPWQKVGCTPIYGYQDPLQLDGNT